MTAKNAPLFKPFVDALCEGREIEVRDGMDRWQTHTNLCFDQDPNDYRVKSDDPEPEPITAGRVLYDSIKPRLGWSWNDDCEICEEAAAQVIAFHEANKPRVESVDWKSSCMAQIQGAIATIKSHGACLMGTLSVEPTDDHGSNHLQEIAAQGLFINEDDGPEPIAEWRDLVAGVDTWMRGDEWQDPNGGWHNLEPILEGSLFRGLTKGRRRVAPKVDEVLNAEWTPPVSEMISLEWRFKTAPRDRLVWVYKKGYITDRLITAWRDDGVEIGNYAKVTYAELLKDWLQRDGSPCGPPAKK